MLGLTSCLKDDCTENRTFIEFEAIYVQPEEFRIDIVNESPRALKNTGKFYFYNNLILINEVYEGIHIIDNSNPESPTNLGFINIPGNLDIAIKDNMLYADNYVDLLTIDFADPLNASILCRDEDVFSVYHYTEQWGYFIYNKATENTITVDCNDPNFFDDNFNRGGGIFFAEDALNNVTPSGGATTDGGVGQGGSLARFTLSKDHLYVINQSELIAYNVSNAEKPVKTQTSSVSWGIETLFPYKDYLFIGANNGMYIYDITNPEIPQYVSEFRHAQACDPVFVKDDIAYVTLRDGTLCQNFINQLEIIDVSNIRNPELLHTYNMDHPHGLAVRDNNLYLCEGSYGLKVFNTDDLSKIDKNRIEKLDNIDARDVISLSKEHLLVIGADGLHQFDSTEPSNLRSLSHLIVE